MAILRISDFVVVINLRNSPHFNREMEAFDSEAASPWSHCIIDLSGVTILDSSNLARLLKLRKQLIIHDRRMILVALRPQVSSTFTVTGLDNVFDFADSTDAAMALLLGTYPAN